MHTSAREHGKLFLNLYWTDSMTSILEIGSYDVNGSLRMNKPEEAQWIGLDLEEGPGVDVVVAPGEAIPLADKSFDLVLASSVLEHDLEFWKTIRETARVAKADGFIYINVPSNGPFHRFPLDSFRFYPDASISFLKIIRSVHPDAVLIESFISEQLTGEPWNDFVAIFAMNPTTRRPTTLLSDECNASNVWLDGNFQEETFVEGNQDLQTLRLLYDRVNQTEAQLLEIKSSHSWKITQPLRSLGSLLSKITFRKVT